MATVLTASHPTITKAQKVRTLRPAATAPLVTGCDASSALPDSSSSCRQPAPLIVIGFMGGNVRGDNLVHREARLVRDLDHRYPNAVDAMTFANRDEATALRTVLDLLDTDKNGQLSDHEKSAARIVLFGHSWGASKP